MSWKITFLSLTIFLLRLLWLLIKTDSTNISYKLQFINVLAQMTAAKGTAENSENYSEIVKMFLGENPRPSIKVSPFIQSFWQGLM